MAIDPYAPCPGGTGKKAKFCCADLLVELDKIRHMVESNQRLACLEHVNKVDARVGPRACLLAIKSMLEGQLGETEKAVKTVARFKEAYPENPVALAESALLDASQGRIPEAIDAVQRAIAASTNEMGSRVFEAIGALGQMLIGHGLIEAGLAHLRLQAALSAEDDHRALQLITRINGSPQVSVLLKEDDSLWAAPEGSPAQSTLDAIDDLALRGRWREAERQLTEASTTYPDLPEVWHNLAVLRSWLGDKAGQVQALRRYSRLPIDLDDAVEAEAKAQLLSKETEADVISIVEVIYPVLDATELETRLAADRRLSRMPVDPRPYTDRGDVPPRSAFWVLDRPQPTTGVGIARGDIPRAVGQIYLFGKQTDRDARLQLASWQTPTLESVKATVVRIGGDAIGAQQAQNILGKTPALEHALSWNWRLPDDTPFEHRQSLLAEQRREMIREGWAKLPQRILGNRSPETAAGDPSVRIPILASLLLLELSDARPQADSDYNAVRSRLGWPVLNKIVADENEVFEMSVARLGRLDPEKLSDEALLRAFQRITFLRADRATYWFAKELVRRESVHSRVDLAETYGVLAELEDNPEEALKHLDNARKASERDGKSSAPWDLAELSLRLERGEIEHVGRLIAHIRDAHGREQGVGQALYQMLGEAGLIGPDGSLSIPLPQAETRSGIVVPGEQSTSSKLWTPGSESGAPAGGGEKKKLWMPGM